MRRPDVRGFYREAGERLDRGSLRCERCGRTQPMQAGEGAKFLRAGWPQCCGYTMTLENTPTDGGNHG